MTQQDKALPAQPDLETRAIEAAIQTYHGDIILPPKIDLSSMRAAIAAYQSFMREGRPETTLDEWLDIFADAAEYARPGLEGKARAAIHDLFQEARNGK